ncbi:UDP-4-amino-4,6-dideoxy-N-acetyl-beta-L-altrosamine transaminase [Otoolea muris]|uniref:UDP-4-amino-4, 6-dideoxy-N-acetyl-beta-L-altrosamine transaminase n=1 Tax=Otoolea muris TaxID=2941515 RepID=UPI00203EB42D|nr:UDP-4-amino-4,6-dideoxy-N-acetyl-beta-L-altrosamine transaminase [Otoolea muris]
MEKLALFGGKPELGKKISYGRQYIDEADIQAVAEVLKGDFLTCGPKVGETESRLCGLTGARHAVLLSNGTAALHAACIAAGIGEGDEVITTPITFAASANCALYCGAKPVFADIGPETWNISPKEIERNITPRTKAVVAVDFTGQAVKLKEIREICRAHSLVLIEDAAHSIGTVYSGQPVGGIADLTTFSFHPVKTVTAGEGGAVMTDNEEYYKKLLLFRAHGITRNQEWMERAPEGGWYYEQIDLGLNYRMTDIQAALLLSQLDKIGRFAERRREIAARYDQAFGEMEEITVQKEIPESDTVRHLYLLNVNLDFLKTDRKTVYDALEAENVGCNVHYIPVYYFPHYQRLGYKKGLCPNAEALYERLITIPLYYGMSDEDVEGVIRAVRKVMRYFRK